MIEFNDPYTEIYDEIFSKMESAGYETYNHLPSDTAPYPFVFIGEQFSKDRQTKTRMLGSTNLIIHVFDHDDKRQELNQVLSNIRKLIHGIANTKKFSWNIIASTTDVLYENATNYGNKIVHGVLDITLEFE